MKQRHHRHHKDSATIFKEKNLRAIKLRRLFEKFLKITAIVIAIVMATLVILAYTIG